jgi:tetratricopeptide (TPR) repeat protein
MDPDRLRRISTLVDSTFDLSLKQLRSFLDRECAGDPELRAEVERRVIERDTIAVATTRPPTHDASLATGDIINERYRIVRLLGRGGMGEVYEARDLLLEENVAIKTLRADLAGNAAVAQRFHTEISLTRKVTHPNVCRIFEVGMHHRPDRPPLLFFAMELLSGVTLASRIRNGRLTRAEAFPIAVQLAEGLQAAHRAGIVHADFKSANVILVPVPDGVRAVITDFGVARLEQPSDGASAGETLRIAGTLAYMSPEQLSGERITAASDIYSFGIVLFEMASGERPFDDSDLIKSAMLRAGTPEISVRKKVPEIDERWDTAIARCLQRDPAHRFSSAGELANWFREGQRWNVRYWTRGDWIRASIAAVIVLLAGISAWTWQYRPYEPKPDAIRSYQAGVDALYSMTYETARKALEQTVAIDPTFALAHASLARAYDELDYTDRAKDSMLRAVTAAQESRLTPDDERRLRALRFMVSRDYERAVPVVAQLESEASGSDKAAAALESGWLAQQMEDSNAASAAFERALKIAPSNAAAKLRLGFMFGRRGGQNDLALALQAFTEAEQLYGASGDYEGATQTLLERANLLVRRSRQKEALPVIERALSVAQTVGNHYQEVRLMLLKGTALRDLNETAGAMTLVREAVERANSENMDNLATSGQIDLANIYLRMGDLKTAEPVLLRALDMAKRTRVRRIEARASLALASMYEQGRRPEEARTLIQAGLTFYREAGYRRESVQAAVLLGGVLQQLGDNDEGIRILRETLPQAVQLQDKRAEAQLHERIADNLRDQGDWPDALAEHQRAAMLEPSTVQAQYLRVAATGLQWRLGLRDDAEASLSEADRFEKNAPNPRLASMIHAQRAEVAYADDQLEQARALAGRASQPGADEETMRQITMLHSRLLIRMGRVLEGLTIARAEIEAYERAQLPGLAAWSRLSIAEALDRAGDRPQALTMAQGALEYFQSKRVWEGIWRAHAIAAHAAGDRAEAEGHKTAAAAALAQLRLSWTPQVVDRYLQRTDNRLLERAGS